MFLKSMTLKGFKSFADSTTLQLEPGVTVVVGPNGSGKSNVVDAIAWVLGAQAPSAVRSQKMDDVIFAGTARRPALGRAEVTLTIDNSTGQLPIEFSEVTVSRTLFRSGDSDYAINGVSCRLLDIQELLSDAGVGRQQHVIVSQGQIDAVLNARPEDRRAIIEEAAGVLKFRRRREKAARRLDATDASLTRVQDLLREVRRQLRPLERQADAARRHGQVVAELGALQRFLIGRDIAALRTRLHNAAAERRRAADAEVELRAGLARLDTEVMAAEAELTARGEADLGDEMVRVEQLRERTRGLAAVVGERRRSLERDRGQLMGADVVANLEGDARSLTVQLGEVHAQLDAREPIEAALVADEERLAARRAEVATRLAAPLANEAGSLAAETRGELRMLQQAAVRATAELERLRVRSASVESRLREVDERIDERRRRIAQAEAIESELVTALEAAQTARRTVAAELERADDEMRETQQQVQQWAARVDALTLALEHARARAGSEQLADVAGMLGTLLELVEIDPGWEAAVEAALGEALGAVVVDSVDSARGALAALRARDVHGAVLALGSVTVAPGAGVPMSPPVGEAVRAHVRSRDEGVERLLDALVARAVRVASWEAALDAVLRSPDVVAVTDAGDRFSPTGWSVGGEVGGATAAALEQAQAALDAAQEELDVRVRARAQLAQREHESAAAETDATRRLDEYDASFSAASDDLVRAHDERRTLTAERERLERALEESAAPRQADRSRIDELEALLPSLEEREVAEQREAAARGALRAALDRETAELNARRRQIEVESAGLVERRQLLEQRLAATEERLRADSVARAQAAHRRELVQRDLDVLAQLAERLEAHRQVIERRHASLAETRRRRNDEVRALAARLDAARRSRSELEQRLEAERELARRAEMEDAEVRVRLEGVVEALRRDHDIEPDAAVAAPRPELAEGVSPAARARELERELRLMGPINPLALEEYSELQQRHEFLEAQLDDVRSTRRDLLRVIKAVDQEIQSVFAAAYADVAAHFTSLFATLFPGGSGRLSLTNPDDLLNTGIEVEAKPSGKNVKKLSLLSGGERSLTALAYLFAVFRSRPSPFYVMDEVEAALDDVNLHRFLGLIQEFRGEAQLLIVSHQKRTMEAGDCLLGVTMQPGGSSKVVSERVSS